MRDSAESRGRPCLVARSPLDLWRGTQTGCVSIVKTMLPITYWEPLGEAVLVAISRDAGAWRSTQRGYSNGRNRHASLVTGRPAQAVDAKGGGSILHLAVHQIVFANCPDR